jgi:hypothetical protein
VSAWTIDTGTNVLALAENTVGLRDYAVSFNVTNRAKPQQGQLISISSSNEDDNAQQMVRDVSVALTHVYDTVPDNAHPMKILAADFTVKKVGQSVPYPGCTNTITMTLSFNVPLLTACPTYIRVTGIADTAALNRWKSDDIYESAYETTLIGLQHLEKDNTTWATSNDLWWAPGICEDPNDRLGDHHFMERCDLGTVGPAGSPDRKECIRIGSPGWAMQKTDACQSKVQTRLHMHLAQDTNPNFNYVIQFQLENPLEGQNSSDLYVEGRIGVDGDTKQNFQYIGDSHSAGAVNNQVAGPADACDSTFTAPRYLMDKDGGLLCCASCSVAGHAVAGDANPLKVHAPFFCVKNIGQSSPYPCANNTLTVTIMANSFFSGNGSVIEISNLQGAIAPDGPMQLLDGPNELGHHLFFAAELESDDWRFPANRTRGRGLWDNTNKKLTLYVARDTDCATEYVFRFQITNPKVQQGAPTVSIKASSIGDSKWTRTDAGQVNIAIAAMVPDSLSVLTISPDCVAGDAHPLKIWALTFKTSVAEQSSPYPCDVNMIRVTFKTNVPLLNTKGLGACSPTMTVTGLDNAIAPMGFINITQDSWYADTANKFVGYVYGPADTYRGDWSVAFAGLALRPATNLSSWTLCRAWRPTLTTRLMSPCGTLQKGRPALRLRSQLGAVAIGAQTPTAGTKVDAHPHNRKAPRRNSRRRLGMCAR